jgi:AbrB family looped-hinge helix DNA binding protein
MANTVTTKGQVTIPKQVRDLLGIKPGSSVAFEVADEAALLAAKAHLETQGVPVLGPTYHGIFKSIYFFDPNGHRLELACNIGTPEQLAELARLAPVMLEEWSRTRRAPRQAAWLHQPPEASA